MTSPLLDGGAVASARDQWDRAAAGWNEHGPAIRAWLTHATAAMISMAGVTSGSRVLDVAAGAGDQSLAVAKMVGPKGSVLATDVSPQILAYAELNARSAGYRTIAVKVTDGVSLDVPPESFDAVVCRLGLMFFPSPLDGLRDMFQALRPGGGACTVVFAEPSVNPCLSILMQTALRRAGLPPRDPFAPGALTSLGKPGHIDELFRQAGFQHVATTRLNAPFRAPAVGRYLEFVRSAAGPILEILETLDAAGREAAWCDIEEQLRIYDTPEGWVGPNQLLLTAGRKPL
ncbi:class I SAM-dependent methyltransferase [Alsobacter sp. KACC 23698]|uniref:Class I SAM-dependent methyltransferase n=1 Tax=Alsobacter sp. KACC 23698 TaxID=3149229 RepID=A0AAU7JEB2_9HYPH